jgi:phosphoribosylamine--glycine ligase
MNTGLPWCSPERGTSDTDKSFAQHDDRNFRITRDFEMANYLVIGSGGREHALAWRLAQDDPKNRVWVAPGNAGIALDTAITGCPMIEADDFGALAAFARENAIDLTVVGPEAPLSNGIVDHFREAGLAVFGPDSAAAELEASKAFAKSVMTAAGVRTASYEVFESLENAKTYVESADHPLVIKADGLAAGKGVVICNDVAQSLHTLDGMLSGESFGEAGERVVIEEFLEGPEMSFMVITDGDAIVPLSTSQDHKRLGEGDTGPNTGGMGAITPSPSVTPDLREAVLDDVIRPVLDELASRGIRYRGFLYAGLMLTERGPYVLEFNVRLGDPETQALMFAFEGQLGPILAAAAADNLAEDGHTTAESARHACCVVLASGGYPGSGGRGQLIFGLDDVPRLAKVFHAGTGAGTAPGQLVNTGGRVLGVTAKGSDLEAARRAAYEAVSCVDWEGMRYRRDIGGPILDD